MVGKSKRQQSGQKRAVIYARVSTEKQENNTSLDSQVSACVKHAESLGYSIGEIVRETHTGGELWQRDKLSRIREEIKAGQYQALICYATDRLARDPIHIGIVAENCERAEAELIFVSEPIDNSVEGQIICFMKGMAARIEREKIKERTQRGRHTRVMSGKIHNWGSELFGYRRDKEAGVRAIYHLEASVVRDIFEWVAVEGLSTRAVIRRLHSMGVSTPSESSSKRNFKDGRKPHWGRGTIRRILTEPAYKGVTYCWRWTHATPKGRVINRPEGERVQLPEGVTPPIVTPQVWEAAQEVLKAQRGDWTRNQQRPDLLRGLIYCGVCGRRLLGQNENGSYRIYRCSSRQTPQGHCGGRRVPAEACEREVWQQVIAVMQDPAIITREMESRKHQGGDKQAQLKADAEAARREVKRLDAIIQRLISRCGEADDDLWNDFQKQIAHAKQQRSGCEAVIADAEAQLNADEEWREGLAELEEFCARVRDQIENLTFNDRRRVLESLGARVVGDAREWRLDVRFPAAPLLILRTGVVDRTSFLSARPAQARRCSPSACRRSCRRWNSMLRWS